MRSRCALAFVLMIVPALVLAGPNAGGVLLVHANTSLVYTTDTTSYCADGKGGGPVHLGCPLATVSARGARTSRVPSRSRAT
jgi:hypothetical protein